MSYDSVALDPGRPNRATSLKLTTAANAVNAGLDAYYAYKNRIYMDHSNQGNAAWIIHQDTKNSGDAFNSRTSEGNVTWISDAQFGGTAYAHTWLSKGVMWETSPLHYWETPERYNVTWWTARSDEDDNSPVTQYRFLNTRYDDKGWVTNKSLDETYTMVQRRGYQIEYLGTDESGFGEFLIFWYDTSVDDASNDKTYCFLTCDADGNWGTKKYTSRTAAQADLENLKLYLYQYQTWRNSKNYKSIKYTVDKTVYNVETGTSLEQVISLIHDQGNLTVLCGDNREYLQIPRSGAGDDKVGYYYLKFDKPYDASGKSVNQYTVSVMYCHEATTDMVLTTLTVNLYDRELEFTGETTYTVEKGTAESDVRSTVTQNIAVAQTFSNINGNLSEPAAVSYSEPPEAGKYWLEFNDSSDDASAYLVNVNYRRTDGSDILVETLTVYTNEVIESFEEPENKLGVAMLNAELSAIVLDENGQNITVNINGEDRNVTVGMLTVNENTTKDGEAVTNIGLPVDTSAEGNYENLTLTYGGQVICTDFALRIAKGDPALNYPAKGQPGYVGTGKVGTTSESDFFKNGVANIQLSANGVPVEKGVDLIVVMDLSGSMLNELDSNNDAASYQESRVVAMENSLKEMIKTLQASGTDVRIAMSDFGDLDNFELDGVVVDSSIADKNMFDMDFDNNQYAESFEFANHLNYIFKNDANKRTHNPYGIHLTKYDGAMPGAHHGVVIPTVYTGSGRVEADAFVNVNTLYDGTKFTSSMKNIISMLDENVQKEIGTNYDVGLEYAYNLGYAIRQDNIANGYDREIICVFMSDGGPMQFNYFTGTTKTDAWTDWITGNIDSIGTNGYSKNNLPNGVAALQDNLLKLLKAGTLVRPEYQRGPWYENICYQPKEGGGYWNGGSVDNTIKKFSEGYFVYRDRSASSLNKAETFFDYMNHLAYDLDWDFLCRIAWANGIEEFDEEYYRKNEALPELVELLLDKVLIGYEHDGSGNYYAVYKTKLKDPGMSEQEFYPQYTGTSTDFFAAMKAVGVECTWDLVGKIAYKNRVYLTDFMAAMDVTPKSQSKSDLRTAGTDALTKIVDQLRTAPEGYSHGTVSPYTHFYNEEGRNWWAEAIKGDTDKLYPVINKYAYENSPYQPYTYYGDVREDYNGQKYMSGYRGLGIDIYSISFSMADDNQIKVSDAEQILQRISSNDGSSGNYFFAASSQASLTDALKSVVANMSAGSTDAYFTDTIGKAYDLYYGQVTGVTEVPAIKVMNYALDASGNRIGTPSVVETITFADKNSDGIIEAYSDQVTNGTVNIWDQTTGLISGLHVIYNTNTDKSVDLYPDATGAAFALQPETFYWLVGSIGETETVLEYQVYLVDSMEGKLDTKGEKIYYDTNEQATLTYVNYLGNQCTVSADSPEYPWKTVLENSMNVDKTVSATDSPDKFKLTLESYGTGTSVLSPASKPADIVLVLDQSSTMYTPVGIDADRISISNLAEVRQQLSGKAIDFDANDTTIQNNAKNLGYYVAIHNSGNYIYIVQYAQNKSGQWGWYYVPVDQTVRTVAVDTENTTPDTDVALAKGYDTASKTYQPYGYGTYAQTTKAALPTSLVTYYQTQYGALYDTLQEFVTDLREESVRSGLNHRVAVVGFASPFYDGWTGYDGTGIYVNGQYHLYDSDYKYRYGDDILDPDLGYQDGTVVYNPDYIIDESKLHSNVVTNQTYQDALVSVRDNFDSVMASVKAYKANYQQTCPSIGITMAQAIFGARTSTDNLFNDPSNALEDKRNPAYIEYANNGNYYPEDQDDEHLKSTYTQDNAEDREEIMILFTDGVPTVRCTADRDMGFRKFKVGDKEKDHPIALEYWSITGGTDDVLDHAYEAKQAGIKIYGIATSDAVMTQYGSDFFQHVSSDDPTAKGQLTVTETWEKDTNQKYYLSDASVSTEIVNTSHTAKGYTMYASDANMNLSKAFKTVYESIESSVELDDTAVLKEVLSDYFDLTSLNTSDIKVYTADYMGRNAAGGHEFSTEWKELTGAQVSFESSDGSNRMDTILVSGFDYKEDYVGYSNDTPHGKKLIVQLEVESREGFWGGNNVPTNKPDTGIYTSEGDPVTYFPMPEANVPVTPVLLAKDKTVYYGSHVGSEQLIDGVTVDGHPVTVNDDGSFGPEVDWMDDYATLSWTEGFTTPGQSVISSREEELYPFSVTLAPLYGGIGNRSERPSNVGGPVVHDNTAEDDANVYVLVPVLTWRDVTIQLGDAVSADFFTANDLVRLTWVQQQVALDITPNYVDTVPGYDKDLTTDPNPNPNAIPVPTETAPTLSYRYSVSGKPMEYTPVNVHVDATYAGGATVLDITNAATFLWEDCRYGGMFHYSRMDQLLKHEGSATSYEFYIHVEGGDVLISDKTVDSVTGTDQFELTMEGYVTGSIEEITVTKPADIVLVLDHSGSMRTPVGANGILRSADQILYQGGGAMTKDQLDPVKGAHMGYYVAQSSTYLGWFVMEYDTVNNKWIGYSVPSTEAIVNKEVDPKNPGSGWTEHTMVQSWSYAQLPEALVFYKSQYGALYDSVLDFVGGLRESGVDHAVSIVGFAGPNSQGSRIYVSGYNPNKPGGPGDETVYKSFDAMYHSNTSDERRQDLFRMAMKSVQDDTQYAELLTNINAIETNYSYTSPSSGLRLADDLLKYNASDRGVSRDRILVLFTDGMPNRSVQDWVSDTDEDQSGVNGGLTSSLNETQIFNEVISMAHQLKKPQSEGGREAKVYTVSTSTMVNSMGLEDDPLTFMHYASSDYPDAVSLTEPGTPIAEQKYTKEVSGVSDLNILFNDVTTQVSGTKVQLDGSAILRDTISDDFQLAGAVEQSITVYQQVYLGNNVWAEPVQVTGSHIKITTSSTEGSNGRTDLIEVTGFNYSEEYISEEGIERTVTNAAGERVTVTDYQGSKLLVKVRIKARDDFWGGTKVPTNESNAGIFGSNGEELDLFPIPETDVPYKYFLQADTVVIDYGLPVNIDVADNDIRPDYANATLMGIRFGDTLDKYAAAESDGASVTEVKPDENTPIHGTMELVEGKLCYTHSDMKMDQAEVFTYEMQYEAKSDQSLLYNYATVTVIPATIIYYEDNFLQYQYYTYDSDWNCSEPQAGGWTPDGEEADLSQAQDRPGDVLDRIDANNIYGYDQAYSGMTTYSYGSAMKTRVYDGYSALAKFTFTGTGFDIVSLSSNTTGAIMVTITDTEGNYVTGIMVDSYYGYKLDENGEMVLDPDVSNSLYQVPVMKVDLNQTKVYDNETWTWTGDYWGYGTYNVEIDVSYADFFNHGQCRCADDCDGCFEFYLDAIRVYNPAGTGGSNCQTSQGAYIADGEGWPVYQELRNMIIAHDDLSEEVNAGAVYIDCNGAPALKDYTSFGPNNEVYLTANKAIAFKLDALNYANEIFDSADFEEDLVKSVHIGMRSLDGLGNVVISSGEESVTYDLSATDMYFDISKFINKTVTIKSDNNLVVISNLKITHKVDPYGVQGTGNVELDPSAIVTVSNNDAGIALDILTAEQLASPTVTPKYPALSFNGMVCYNVFFTAENLGDLTAADLGLAVFNSDVSNGTVENADEVHLGAEKIGDEYMIATNGVNAKYLGDTKYFRAFAKKADGTYVYSKMVSYSARDYATNVLARSNDVKLKQLVVAMLNYGAEAQKFFGYKTDDLMNKDLTADDQALLAGFDASSLNPVGKVDDSKIGVFANNGGFSARRPAISFKGAFEINYFMTPAYAVDGDMTMYFWSEDTYNAVTELTAENADKAVVMTPENGTYTACSDEIFARRLDETVYVAAVYESGGETYCTGVLAYSIAAYCQKPPAGVQDLATAAAIYGCTAKQYFGV